MRPPRALLITPTWVAFAAHQAVKSALAAHAGDVRSPDRIPLYIRRLRAGFLAVQPPTPARAWYCHVNMRGASAQVQSCQAMWRHATNRQAPNDSTPRPLLDMFAAQRKYDFTRMLRQSCCSSMFRSGVVAKSVVSAPPLMRRHAHLGQTCE